MPRRTVGCLSQVPCRHATHCAALLVDRIRRMPLLGRRRHALRAGERFRGGVGCDPGHHRRTDHVARPGVSPRRSVSVDTAISGCRAPLLSVSEVAASFGRTRVDFRRARPPPRCVPRYAALPEQIRSAYKCNLVLFAVMLGLSSACSTARHCTLEGAGGAPAWNFGAGEQRHRNHLLIDPWPTSLFSAWTGLTGMNSSTDNFGPPFCATGYWRRGVPGEQGRAGRTGCLKAQQVPRAVRSPRAKKDGTCSFHVAVSPRTRCPHAWIACAPRAACMFACRPFGGAGERPLPGIADVHPRRRLTDGHVLHAPDALPPHNRDAGVARQRGPLWWLEASL